MIYRFLGSESEIHGVAKLTRVGQSIQLEASVAREAITGGCSLLPEVEFDALGFTDEELREFGGTYGRAAAPPEFIAKLRAGWVRVAELRAELEVV